MHISLYNIFKSRFWVPSRKLIVGQRPLKQAVPASEMIVQNRQEVARVLLDLLLQLRQRDIFDLDLLARLQLILLKELIESLSIARGSE